MLGVIGLSFVGALLFALLPTGIGFLISIIKKVRFKRDVRYEIISFVVNFLCMVLILYVSCEPQTFIIVISWMWVPLLVLSLVFDLFDDNFEKHYIKSTFILAIITVLLFFSRFFILTQNMIFVYDISEINMPYSAISIDEIKHNNIVAKLCEDENSAYRIGDPNIRKVNGDFVYIYRIGNNSFQNYIPGYVVYEMDEEPRFISKRINFDTSFFNSRDALRTVRREYPTVIIGEHKFDIDDDWNPYEVFVYRENLFYSNGKDYGLILLNLSDGTCEKYPVSENKIPEWVDFTSFEPK